MQDHFTRVAEGAGLVDLAKGCRPQIIELPPWRRITLERLAHDVRRLLFDAGCRVLDASDPKILFAATPDQEPALTDAATVWESDDVGLMSIGVTPLPPRPDEYEIEYVNLWARGYPLDDGFVVSAGSEFRTEINPSVNPILVTRRKELREAGALIPIRGVSDRLRLTVSIALPSMSIAAKVVTGAHVNAALWKKLRTLQPDPAT